MDQNPKKLFVCLATLIFVFLCTAGLSMAQDQADWVFHNGKILTVATDQGDFPIAEAVAVKDGKILAVGSNSSVLALAGPATKKVDLKGRAVMPGIVDTHKHPNRDALLNYAKYLPPKYEKAIKASGMIFDWRNKADVLMQIERIARNAEAEPEVVVISGRPMMGASGWGPTYLVNAPPPGYAEGRGILINEFANLKLTLPELDKASAGRAVVIVLGGGGMMNSKAVDMAMKLFPGRKISYNDVCCLEQLRPWPQEDVLEPLYKRELEEKIASLGYTTVSSRFSRSEIATFGLLDQKGELTVRVGYAQQLPAMPLLSEYDRLLQRLKEVEQKYNSDYLWMTGLDGVPLDGSPDAGGICASFSRVQGVSEDFGFRADDCYDWNKPQDDLLEILRRLNREGYRFSNMHSWGNLALQHALEFYEQLDKENPIKGRRFAFDHSALLSPRVLELASKFGIYWSVAPMTVYGGQRAIMMRQVFGDEMVDAWGAPTKKILDAGMKTSFEAEFLSVDPWIGYRILVTRRDDFGRVRGTQNAVDRKTALRMMTRWGAEYVLREKQIGSIEPGKFADFIVLDQNLLDPNEVPDDRLATIRVLMTMIGGKVIYRSTSFEM
ncbi:MAG: amidohydrolase family protein [Acidobacteria bacterium]|nr:amidohydrolase family protein [Acidobacteriota bacterium]